MSWNIFGLINRTSVPSFNFVAHTVRGQKIGKSLKYAGSFSSFEMFSPFPSCISEIRIFGHGMPILNFIYLSESRMIRAKILLIIYFFKIYLYP